MRPLRLCTMSWGDKHIDQFFRACLRSLLQPNNLPAVLASGRKVVWDFLCRGEDQVKISVGLDRALEGRGLDCYLSFLPIDGMEFDGFYYKVLGRGVASAMNRCLDDDALLFLAPPDTFFADGALTNLLEYNQERKLCLAGTHVRVDAAAFSRRLADLSDNYVFPPDKLVTAAFLDGHRSLLEADVGGEVNNARDGGLFIQKIGPALWTVTHRLPTVYLCSPTDKDCGRFRERYFNDWDWVWPARLMLENRYKYLTSSDLFFAVELTDAERNVPFTFRQRLTDEFRARDYHFDHNKYVVGLLRGLS